MTPLTYYNKQLLSYQYTFNTFFNTGIQGLRGGACLVARREGTGDVGAKRVGMGYM